MTENSKGLESPLEQEKLEDLKKEDFDLERSEATRFRAIAEGKFSVPRPNGHAVRSQGGLQGHGKAYGAQLGKAETLSQVLVAVPNASLALQGIERRD